MDSELSRDLGQMGYGRGVRAASGIRLHPLTQQVNRAQATKPAVKPATRASQYRPVHVLKKEVWAWGRSVLSLRDQQCDECGGAILRNEEVTRSSRGWLVCKVCRPLHPCGEGYPRVLGCLECAWQHRQDPIPDIPPFTWEGSPSEIINRALAGDVGRKVRITIEVLEI